MSNSPADPFEILADEITAIRRQIDHLQRTSLNRQEAEDLNSMVTRSLDRMANLGPYLTGTITSQLRLSVDEIRDTATNAAQSAAEAAIHHTHSQSLDAARSLSQAAGEARREAWRYSGGFWVWLASVGLAGAILGALVVYWLQPPADAALFTRDPALFCEPAGGQVATNTEGRRFCGIWIDPPES